MRQEDQTEGGRIFPSLLFSASAYGTAKDLPDAQAYFL